MLNEFCYCEIKKTEKDTLIINRRLANQTKARGSSFTLGWHYRSLLASSSSSTLTYSKLMNFVNIGMQILLLKLSMLLPSMPEVQRWLH